MGTPSVHIFAILLTTLALLLNSFHRWIFVQLFPTMHAGEHYGWTFSPKLWAFLHRLCFLNIFRYLLTGPKLTFPSSHQRRAGGNISKQLLNAKSAHKSSWKVTGFGKLYHPYITVWGTCWPDHFLPSYPFGAPACVSSPRHGMEPR